MSGVLDTGGDSPLEIKLDCDGDQATVHLRGELDLESAPHFADALSDLQNNGTRNIVIDLSRLDFIDSTGLHHLVVALKRQREKGGDVALRAPSEQTRRVLEMVGLTQVFTIS